MTPNKLCEKLFGFNPTVLGDQANLMEAGTLKTDSEACGRIAHGRHFCPKEKKLQKG